MKLKDLVEALAGEIEHAQREMGEHLRPLAEHEVDDPAFLDAFDRYSGLAQRMGEAADLAGFPGLQGVCAHVAENCLLLSVTPASGRGELLGFLRAWPPLVVHYLRNLDDPSAAAGLLDSMRNAPMPMGEDEALKIVHKLGAMPLQVAQAGGGDDARPVLATPADVALVVPADADERLMEGFFTEAPEQARHLVQLARNMAAGHGDSSDVIAAKRLAHTLKGSGAIIGLRGITALSHHLEDILEHFEHAGGKVSPVVGEALLDAADCLEQMVGFIIGADDPPQQAQAVLQRVLDLANCIDRGEAVDEMVVRAPMHRHPNPLPPAGEGASREEEVGLPPSSLRGEGRGEGQPPAADRPIAVPEMAMRVSLRRIEELFRVSGELTVHGTAMEARIQALTDSARQLLAQNLRVQKRLFELETLVDVRNLATMRARGQQLARAGFDALELDQYSELHSTSHALVEEAADARALSSRLEEDIAQLATQQARQQRLGKDMQHLVIGTRMTEVGALESRLHRNVRTTCQATGKQASLVVQGGGTLIDTDVLNKLAEPLLHLLRNAVDHGIELPEVRRAAGKTAAGRIVLTFSRQGQQVVLRCEDDGRGLDLAAIRRRALERGLLADGRSLGDEEIARLVLLPGFSTRDTVSEVSGRGVGLDVVREWAGAMNGSIRIATGAKGGCLIELRFAASLSTIQSLVVEAAGQRFALPSVQVEQAVPRGVGTFEEIGGRMVYRHGDRVVPAVFLADAARLTREADKPPQDHDAVLVRVDERTQALAVDRLVDARELLVQSPGRHARHVSGVAGLSILGDGGVAVNLDLAHLLSGGGQRAAQRTAVAAQPAAQEAPGVLVVDDALTVRNALRQLVQDAGYRVEAARDGIEAIGALRDFKPSIVLTDLEMPNMNGVELASHLRSREDAMKRVPIIMITSRSQEKHRRMAEQAGVDTYITKPYNDGELLQAIRRHVAA